MQQHGGAAIIYLVGVSRFYKDTSALLIRFLILLSIICTSTKFAFPPFLYNLTEFPLMDHCIIVVYRRTLVLSIVVAGVVFCFFFDDTDDDDDDPLFLLLFIIMIFHFVFESTHFVR
jgi:hypothetical protein